MTKSGKDEPIRNDFSQRQLHDAAALGPAAVKGYFPAPGALSDDRSKVNGGIWIAGKHPANKSREE